jgi:hypothetical protein
VCSELPTRRKLALALPALQVKVTLEELNVDPGGGLSITELPFGGGVGVGVALGVGVGVPPGVGVGVGVGVGPAEHVENLNEPIRVIQLRPGAAKYMFVYQKVQSSVGSTVIAL